jgi:formate hydrogenlyase transcriptional activator
VSPLSALRLDFEERRYIVLLTVADFVSLRPDPAELFRDVGPRLRGVVPFDLFQFALFEPLHGILKTYLWEGKEWPRNSQNVAPKDSTVGPVWRDQTVLMIEDLESDERFVFELRSLRERKMRSYCGLPLAILRQKLGALAVASKLAGAFSPADVQFLHRVVQMMALCIDPALSHAVVITERDRLLGEQREAAQRLEGYSHGWIASRAAAHDDGLQAMINRAESRRPKASNAAWFSAAEALIESEPLLTAYFNASKVGLCILDTDFRYIAINQTLAEINGIPAEEHLGKSIRESLGNVAELIELQLKRVLETQQPILNLEISATLPNRTEPGHWIEHYIPIKGANGKTKQIGVVVVETTQQKRLEESLHGVSETLRKEKKRQQVLSEVSRVLSEDWELRRVFPQISAFLRRSLRQEYAAISVRDEKSGQLVRQAMDFPLGKDLSAGERISTAKGPGTKVLRERSSQIFTHDDFQGIDPAVADSLMAEGIKSLCCVPLLRPTGPMGVLVLGSTRTDAFKTDDLTLLSQVAALVAIALENARIGLQVEQFKSRLQQEKRYLEGQPRTQLHFEEIIGESPALKLVLDQVAVVSSSDASVLILGETGTGKGLIARALHRTSRRHEQAFVSLNCAAIPTGLLESELFGHEKGAFTGAVSQKIGRLELADKGTLFLDEIGEIPLEVQPKLLRVLQDHEFERLGGTRTIKVDLRLIAATNRDLGRSMIEKEFRSDLFYRLNVFPIRLPSLRERREDIPILVRYFVQKFARRMERVIERISSETMDALIQWHWPGNVRELENFIERSVILTDGTALRAPLDELRNYSPGHASTEQSLEATEREHIVRVLRQTGGRISGPEGAAHRLGLKRSTLQSKLQRLGITRNDYSGPKPD